MSEIQIENGFKHCGSHHFCLEFVITFGHSTVFCLGNTVHRQLHGACREYCTVWAGLKSLPAARNLKGDPMVTLIIRSIRSIIERSPNTSLARKVRHRGLSASRVQLHYRVYIICQKGRTVILTAWNAYRTAYHLRILLKPPQHYINRLHHCS
jgi:hypothetical protein